MAGFWRIEARAAVGLGVAVRIVHSEAAGALRLNEHDRILARRPAHNNGG